MNKPTITPSMLEAWDLYLADIVSKEDLINRLLRVDTPPTLKMKIGIAYHNFIQSCGDGALEYDGFSLDNRSACAYKLDTMGTGFQHEVPFAHELENCILSGRVDGISLSGVVHEYKTSDNAKSYKDYALSPQWRAYLFLTGYKRVMYHVVRYHFTEKNNLVTTIGLTEFDFSAPSDLLELIHAQTSALQTFANNAGIVIC